MTQPLYAHTNNKRKMKKKKKDGGYASPTSIRYAGRDIQIKLRKVRGAKQYKGSLSFDKK
jgi:hypothetical protein